ncbi:MAG: hypothetical protein B5M56_09075, partial [Desulfococcus sp. 4484_241]
PGSAACNQTGSVTGLDINEIQLPGAYLLWVAWPLFLKTLIFSAGEHFTWDVATRGKCLVLYRRLANERGASAMELTRKRLIFILRLLVIITASYLMLLSPGGRILKYWVYGFIALYLSSNLALSFIPDKYFYRPVLFYGIVVFDITMLVIGIYFTGMGGTDLYLVFFLIVCLATLGSELKNLCVAGVLFSCVYGWVLYKQGLLQGGMASTGYALRIPFILVVTLFLGYIVDTQTKEKQRALAESEKRFRNFVANLPVGAYQVTLDETPRLLLTNRAFVKMFGYSNFKEALAMPVDSCMGINGKKFTELFPAGDCRLDGFPGDLKRRDGTVFNARIWARRYEHGGKSIIEGVVIDETRLKQAESALSESEKRLKAVIDASFDLVYEWVPENGRLLWFGDINKILGYQETMEIDTTGKFQELLHPDDADRFSNMVISRSETVENKKFSIEYRIKDGNGSWRYWSDQSVPLMDEGNRPVKWIGACTDITKRKELETQLQQAQKMEAVGLLAGGIAHNFNNILMGIQGYVSSMLVSRPPSDPDHDILKSIEQSVNKAAGLVKNLLGFARGGAYNPSPIDINSIIKSEDKLFCDTRKEISIHEDLDENLWAVNADANQFQQVLLNLYINAAQAMPARGGDIFVKTENVVLDKADAAAHGVLPGRFVKITVRDNGCGMDEATMKKIFDPFFTTRKDGTGTGLGLSSVYGIVLNHGGFIQVASKQGKGTTFFIYLPAEGVVLREKQEKEGEATPIARGKERILVVDDEQMVANACGRLLKKLGYDVIIANSGPEAVEIYKNQGSRIDMVLLDMLMPGMDGGETYDSLRQSDPEVKVLLSSGFSLNRQAKEILDRGCDGFIQKPYNIEEISQKVRKILNSKAD